MVFAETIRQHKQYLYSQPYKLRIFFFFENRINLIISETFRNIHFSEKNSRSSRQIAQNCIFRRRQICPLHHFKGQTPRRNENRAKPIVFELFKQLNFKSISFSTIKMRYFGNLISRLSGVKMIQRKSYFVF